MGGRQRTCKDNLRKCHKNLCKLSNAIVLPIIRHLNFKVGLLLTLDRQIQWSVHDAIAVVSNAGVDSLLCWCHIIKGEGKVGCCIPQKLISSKQPGNPGRRVAVHLTVERHWTALHHLWGHVYPHGPGSIWNTGVKQNVPGEVWVSNTGGTRLNKLLNGLLLNVCVLLWAQ